MSGYLLKKKANSTSNSTQQIKQPNTAKLSNIFNSVRERFIKHLNSIIEFSSTRKLEKEGVFFGNEKSFLYEIIRFEDRFIKNLMLIPPLLAQTEKIRPYFRFTRELFEEMAFLNSLGESRAC